MEASMFEGGDLWSPIAEAATNNNKKRKKMKNKRRFSDEQIKSLESIFENEPKLEPRKKVQLAGDLGLHPRQVAIWFQNKRARWKSRQLEHDFSILRNNYNALSSRFDSLNKEKQSLLLQLHKLKELVAKSSSLEGAQFYGGDVGITLGVDAGTEAGIHDRESENNSKGKRSAEAEEEHKPGLGVEDGSEYAVSKLSDDGCSGQTTKYFTMDDEGLLGMVEPACSSLSSHEEWQSLHPQSLFDRSTSSCEWWDLPLLG